MTIVADIWGLSRLNCSNKQARIDYYHTLDSSDVITLKSQNSNHVKFKGQTFNPRSIT